MSIANCIIQTAPMWTGLAAYLFLKERISKYDVIGMIVSFIGVVVLNSPFDHQQTDFTVSDFFFGSAFAFSGAIGSSIAYMCMRIMKDIHFTISPFWYSSGCTFMAPMMYAFWSNHHYVPRVNKVTPTHAGVYDWQTIWLITLASVSSFFG